jgi:enoyl-CoA hydratase/carnithine racemase
LHRLGKPSRKRDGFPSRRKARAQSWGWLVYERRLFHSLFATDDQKEGMAAFVEKRAASFAHR